MTTENTSDAIRASAPRQLDAAALANLRRESLTALTMPVAIAMTEGGFVGVVADKVYHVHPGLLALITAAPMFGNLSSFVWARLSTGRPKVRFIVSLHISLVLLIACAVALPSGAGGAWFLAAGVVASRVIMSGVLTVRSTVWRLNYPRFTRGRVTSRLVLIASLTMMGSALVGSKILDTNPASFRVLYPAAALIACIGIVAFSRVRVRDEAAHLAEESDLDMNGIGEGEPSEQNGGARPGMWSVLRSDPLFGRYMACQFALGVGNMMVQAPLIHLVSRQLQASYFVSIGLVQVLPLFMATCTMHAWGSYLDRVHVAEFRKYQSAVWTVSHIVTCLGAMTGLLPLIALGRMILGVGRGGGAVAWQIGHNDFATSQMATLYMGVHATLTGVRGAFAPFMGILLYLGWQPVRIPYTDAVLPGYAGLGPLVFLIAAAFTTVSGVGFVDLHRRIARPATS